MKQKFLKLILISISILILNTTNAKHLIFKPLEDTGFINFNVFKKLSTKQIMAKYGTNDTAKSIINYYTQKYKKKKRTINWVLKITGGLLGLFGLNTLISGKDSSIYSFIVVIAAGLGVLYLSTITISVMLINLIPYRKKVFYTQLKYYYENKTLSNWLQQVNIIK